MLRDRVYMNLLAMLIRPLAPPLDPPPPICDFMKSFIAICAALETASCFVWPCWTLPWLLC